MKRGVIVPALAVVLMVATTLPSGADFLNGPANPGPVVVRFEGTTGILTFDLERGLIGGTGVSHEDVAAACAGDPSAFQSVADQLLLTPPGAVALLEMGEDLSVFVYEIPPPPFDPFEDFCELFTTTDPLATGTGDLILNDNDLFVSGGRTNSFGSRTVGWVTDQGGNVFRYTAVDRLQIDKDGNFVVRVSSIHLN